MFDSLFNDTLSFMNRYFLHFLLAFCFTWSNAIHLHNACNILRKRETDFNIHRLKHIVQLKLSQKDTCISWLNIMFNRQVLLHESQRPVQMSEEYQVRENEKVNSNMRTNLFNFEALETWSWKPKNLEISFLSIFQGYANEGGHFLDRCRTWKMH